MWFSFMVILPWLKVRVADLGNTRISHETGYVRTDSCFRNKARHAVVIGNDAHPGFALLGLYAK